MARAERQADVEWTGDLMRGKGSLEVGTGAIADQGVTFPRRTGEPEGHTSPEELIAAAHASCYAMALSAELASGGNPPERLHVTARTAVEETDDGLKITSVDLDVKGTVPGLDAAGFEEAARRGEQACPVSNALRGNVEIRVNASLG